MTPASRFVPYSFARDNAILLVPKSERDAEVWISDATPLAALNEVMRVFPGEVRPIVVEPTKLTEAISQTYGDQSGSAQQIVGDIEGEFDITRMMQEVPDVEDLLETEDDAPIIRMINALLTQAARDGASDIHIEPFETLFAGPLPRRRNAARRRPAQARTARCIGVSHQDHGGARHRGEAAAAGRADHAASRRPPGRRARLDAAHRPRRARRAASAAKRTCPSSSSRTSAWRRMRSTASTR